MSLTAKGRGVAQRCWKWVQVHDALLTSGMDASSKTALKEFLHALYGNVPAFQPERIAAEPAAAQRAESNGVRREDARAAVLVGHAPECTRATGGGPSRAVVAKRGR